MQCTLSWSLGRSVAAQYADNPLDFLHMTSYTARSVTWRLVRTAAAQAARDAELGRTVWCVSAWDLWCASYYWMMQLISGAAGGDVSTRRLEPGRSLGSCSSCVRARVWADRPGVYEPGGAAHLHGACGRPPRPALPLRCRLSLPPRCRCPASDVCALRPRAVGVRVQVLVVASCLLMSQIIASFCDVLANMNPENTAFRNRMDHLNRYCRANSLATTTRRELREYLIRAKHVQVRPPDRPSMQPAVHPASLRVRPSTPPALAARHAEP